MSKVKKILLILSYGLFVVIGAVQDKDMNNWNEVRSIERKSSSKADGLPQSPLYEFYMNWLAEKAARSFTDKDYEIYNGIVERRNVASTFPAIEAYFVYKITRGNCINLGDEGCINGSIPGSGSDSGYLNNGNNPGK